jgi:hypothetical protein
VSHAGFAWSDEAPQVPPAAGGGAFAWSDEKEQNPSGPVTLNQNRREYTGPTIHGSDFLGDNIPQPPDTRTNKEQAMGALKATGTAVSAVAPVMTMGASLPIQMITGAGAGALGAKSQGATNTEAVESAAVGGALPAVLPAVGRFGGRIINRAIAPIADALRPAPKFPGAPFPEAPPAGEFVDAAPVTSRAAPPIAPSEVVQPKLLPETASPASNAGEYRAGPGEVEPEDVGAPNSRILGGRKGMIVTMPSEGGTRGLLSGESVPGHAGQIVESVAKPAPPNPARIGDALNEGLGGKLPEGHIPVKGSSVIRSYKYDPAAREFEAATTGGTYIHGDVSPEQVKAFENAPSKGKAWGDLKNNSTYVGKIVNGERVAAKPPRGLASADPNDLTPILKESVSRANAAKAARIAKPN